MRVPLVFVASLGVLLVVAPGAFAKRPGLFAPASASQGSRLVLTVDTGGARSCTLVATGPDGKQHTVKLSRRYKGAYVLRGTVRSAAARGRWDVRVRCRRRASPSAAIQVSGTRAERTGGLLKNPKASAFSRKLPAGFYAPAPNQDDPNAPKEPLPDGLGADAGDRGRGAIEWAMAQQGRTDYYMWCLKFVANAFGAAAAGFPSAQAAANGLGTQGRGEPASNAPAGSLMFFYYRTSDGAELGHVGISLGDGRMISGLKTVRIDAVDADPYWHANYLGWAYAPASWPGRAPSTAPEPNPGTQAPPPPPRKVVTVDNRVTNGMTMREDPAGPASLSSAPRIKCASNNCAIGDTDRKTGDPYDAAVCQTTGERTTNGNDSDPADDNNPDRAESTRYYGIKLADGRFGYLNEVWVQKADRGGLGLPGC